MSYYSSCFSPNHPPPPFVSSNATLCYELTAFNS